MLNIVDESRPRKGLRFRKRINLLLTFVPKEDLVGLGEVVLLDEPTDKWRKERLKNAAAAYYPGRGTRLGSIELYANRVFKGALPPLFFIPNAATAIMARSFFHEVGHHRNKARHAITKSREEVSADAYADERFEEFDRYYAAFARKAVRWPLMKLYNFVLSRTEPHNTSFHRLRTAVRERPSDVSALLDLAHMHFYFWNLRASQRLCKRALRLRPDSGDVYYDLACIAWRKRNWSKSVSLFELAMKYGTGRPSVRHWLGKARSRARRTG